MYMEISQLLVGELRFKIRSVFDEGQDTKRL